ERVVRRVLRVGRVVAWHVPGPGDAGVETALEVVLGDDDRKIRLEVAEGERAVVEAAPGVGDEADLQAHQGRQEREFVGLGEARNRAGRLPGARVIVKEGDRRRRAFDAQLHVVRRRRPTRRGNVAVAGTGGGFERGGDLNRRGVGGVAVVVVAEVVV